MQTRGKGIEQLKSQQSKDKEQHLNNKICLHERNKLISVAYKRQNRKILTCRMCKLHMAASNSSHRPLCVCLCVCSLCVCDYHSVILIKGLRHTFSHSYTQILSSNSCCGCLYYQQMRNMSHKPLNYHHITHLHDKDCLHDTEHVNKPVRCIQL